MRAYARTGSLGRG